MDLGVGGVVPEPLGGGLHPLLIPMVAKNVFKYCGFKELTSCRLVSKDWHENSLKRWRSLAKVKVVPGRDRRRRPMTKFLDFVKNEEKKNGSFKPYSGHYVIGGVKNLDPFLKGFGLQVSALELKDVVFENVGDFRKVIFQSCPNMKELSVLNPIRVLKIRQPNDEPMEWVAPQFGENLNLKRLTLPSSITSFGITRMEILSHFPALEELIQKERSFPGQTWTDSENSRIFRVVHLIRLHDPNKLKLKGIEDLDIVQPVSQNRILEVCLPISLVILLGDKTRAIPETPLELEHLALIIDGDVDHAQRIFYLTVMKQLSKKLRTLELSRTPGLEFLNSSVVSLSVILGFCSQNLEELTLRSRVFSSLDFLTGMPNLKKLTIYGMDDEDVTDHRGNIVKETSFSDLQMQNLVLDKCTELHLAFHLDKKDLKKVVKIFPNVEKVTISLDNELFRVVCKNWTKLVELNVFESSLDDAGITGLDSEEVECANGKGSLPTRQEGQRATPNISFLPNLRRVSISNWEEFPIKRSLGHASATFGFQRVPYLQYLHITNYNVDEDVKETMRNSATSCVFTNVNVQSDKETLLKGLRKRLF